MLAQNLFVSTNVKEDLNRERFPLSLSLRKGKFFNLSSGIGIDPPTFSTVCEYVR